MIPILKTILNDKNILKLKTLLNDQLFDKIFWTKPDYLANLIVRLI